MFIRFILYMLVAVVLISVLRTVIGVLMKGLTSLLSNAGEEQSPRSEPFTQKGGDLHRDPVCGTFVADTTPFQRQVLGRTYYFCSGDCKEKHALAAR
jgi:hypothetical protein